MGLILSDIASPLSPGAFQFALDRSIEVAQHGAPRTIGASAMTRALPPDSAPQRGAINKVQQFLVAWAMWSGCGFVIIGMGAGIILTEIVGVQLLTTELWILTSLLIGLAPIDHLRVIRPPRTGIRRRERLKARTAVRARTKELRRRARSACCTAT